MAALVAVFREVRRVLRPDGTVWLNLGDSYAGYHGNKNHEIPTSAVNGWTNGTNENLRTSTANRNGMKAKDLIGIPWRVAFALQADGWYLRDCIIWHKPNPMPSSVTDRTTTAHEYVFLLTKSARYFYDADAIREPCEGGIQGGRQYAQLRGIEREKRNANGQPGGNGHNMYAHDNPLGRNRRSVWTVSTHPFKGAHFATFPPKLIEPCIKAGTSERGCCPKCGGPWRRVVEMKRASTPVSERLGRQSHNGRPPQQSGYYWTPPVPVASTWVPTCKCHAGEPVPCTVLDPFGGAATTALVANRLGRRAVICDVNFGYLGMGRERVRNDRPKPERKARAPRPVPGELTLFGAVAATA